MLPKMRASMKLRHWSRLRVVQPGFRTAGAADGENVRHDSALL